MTPVLLSFLLLFIIVVSFAFGITVGYWAVCGILHFFNPSRQTRTPTPRRTLAISASGD